MMYGCRCPNNGKMPVYISRPPLSDLRHDHLCECGARAEGKVRIEATTKRIVPHVKCCCGMTSMRILGYLVTINAPFCVRFGRTYRAKASIQE
jgi:hypothetical protein